MSEITTIYNDVDNVLRQEAKEVPHEMIGSEGLQEVIRKMKSGMLERSDSVAIAAPQIGKSLRIVVISGQALAAMKADDPDEKVDPLPDLVLINPEIANLSKDTEALEEGCLSVPDLFGKVERAQKAKIRALDEEGNKIERGARGLLAEVFQHEVDHLNGILFIDRAKETYPVEDQQSAK